MKKTLALIMMSALEMTASAQGKDIRVVDTDYWRDGLTFIQALGPNRYLMDSLIIKGTSALKAEDFAIMRNCCEKGRLTGIDLSQCYAVENNEIPMMAFYPSNINGAPRKAEGIDYDNMYHTNLRYITLPKKIKKIGDNAFAFTNLEAIDIPAMASIGEDAFTGCRSLKNVTFRGKAVRPATEGKAFNGLADGAVLHVAKGNAGGYDSAEKWGGFSKIDENEDVYVVKDVDTDGSRPLADILGSSDMRVDSIRITGTPTVDDFEFLRNNNYYGRLQSLDLSDCTIENGRLYRCWLESLRMPKKMQSIPRTFLRGAKVKHLTMPESYDNIDIEAFNSYNWFTDSILTIPEGCRKIGYMAFVNCHSIKTLVLPSTLEVLEPASLGFTWSEEWLDLKVDIYMNRITPPDCPDNESVNEDGPFACYRSDKGTRDCLTRNWRLFVPMGAKKNYENATHWDHFKTIIETPLLTGTSSGIDGTIAVPQNSMKEVYTTDGRLVAKGATLPQLPKGLYIIKENGKAKKVLK